MECISQPELESVRDTLRVMGFDPQKLCLRVCEQAPPNCQSFDGSGKLVGWEVTGLYDPEVEETNAGAKTVKEMVFKYWTEEELVAKIARTIAVNRELTKWHRSFAPLRGCFLFQSRPEPAASLARAR